MVGQLNIDFKWLKDISDFGESFIKRYDEKIMKEILLEVDAQYPDFYLNK